MANEKQREDLEKELLNCMAQCNEQGIALMLEFVGDMYKIKKYNIATDPQQYNQIIEKEQAKKEKEAAAELEELKKHKTYYDSCDTLRMVGHSLYSFTPESSQALDELIKNDKYYTSFPAAVDVFTLGYIFGKRAERARKKQNILS